MIYGRQSNKTETSTYNTWACEKLYLIVMRPCCNHFGYTHFIYAEPNSYFTEEFKKLVYLITERFMVGIHTSI